MGIYAIFMALMGKILVVEDDADILELVGILLPKHGFTVEKVIKAGDILAQTRMFEPDVILLDINIGGSDGNEICKCLKSHNSLFKTIPVILFSAANDLEKQTVLCGANDFIKKPFELLALVDKIRQYTSIAAP